MIKIIVTGGNGQLARCIKDVAKALSEYTFIFSDSNALDITNTEQITAIFNKEQPNFCINCAGYTAVDKAELEPEDAKLINTLGVKFLAEACAKFGTKLIHISTDFVFDGTATTPYKEDDETNPLGVYGQTKLDGEGVIKALLKEHYIIRTSWLYSEYGHNFMKTILQLGGEKDEIKVVVDQLGTPTNARDLANVVLEIIVKNTEKYGVYHFSNAGSTSWFEFAEKIVALAGLQSTILPISTAQYSAMAKRPKYSVLNTEKIQNTFHIKTLHWLDSLKSVLPSKMGNTGSEN